MVKPRFAALGIMIMALALVVGPLTAQAQDLSQTFTSLDGSFTFQYPGDWSAQEIFGTILLANSEATANAFIEGTDLESGQAIIAMFSPAGVAQNMGSSDAMSPEDLLTILIGDLVGETSTIESMTLGDKPVARATGEDEGESLVIFAIDFGDAGTALVVQDTLPGEEGNFEATTRAIIETMQATAPVEPVETGTVIWQQLREIDPEADFGEGYSDANKVVIGPDDTIYVLDSFVGVHMFDADGNELGNLKLESMFGSMDTLAIGADGTFWTIDYMGTMVQFDSTSTVLSSFETSEVTEIAYFGLDLAVGPDGNLYLLNPREEEEVAIAEILVFSPAGELLRTFAIGTDEYFYDGTIAFGPDNNLYVAEYFGENGVKVFDLEGNLLSEGLGAGHVYSMSGLAIAQDGSIYVSQPDSPIFHFASDGTLLGRFGNSQYMVQDIDYSAETLPPMDMGVFYEIGGVGVLSNGDIIVADSNENWWHLTRITFAE